MSEGALRLRARRAGVSGDVWRRGYTYEEASDSRQENVTLARVLGTVFLKNIYVSMTNTLHLVCQYDKFSSVSIKVRFDELSFLFARV